jgi:hypothetical protein
VVVGNTRAGMGLSSIRRAFKSRQSWVVRTWGVGGPSRCEKSGKGGDGGTGVRGKWGRTRAEVGGALLGAGAA